MARTNPTAAPLPSVQLWIATPADLLDESIARACSAVLSDEERVRAACFHFDRNRREYLATHALARTALTHNHPIAPAEWRFATNAHGKPAADPACGLHFNVSHAEDLVVCLVAQGAEAGVDVEPVARAAEIARLASHVFSSAEQAQLASLSLAEQFDRALSLWVLKEAYIKARGLGLTLPLQGFSFVFGGAEHIQLEMEPVIGDTPTRWRFLMLDHGAHRIALMVGAAPGSPAAPALELWEARPPLGPAVKLSSGAAEWLPRS